MKICFLALLKISTLQLCSETLKLIFWECLFQIQKLIFYTKNLYIRNNKGNCAGIGWMIEHVSHIEPYAKTFVSLCRLLSHFHIRNCEGLCVRTHINQNEFLQPIESFPTCTCLSSFA